MADSLIGGFPSPTIVDTIDNPSSFSTIAPEFTFNCPNLDAFLNQIDFLSNSSTEISSKFGACASAISSPAVSSTSSSSSRSDRLSTVVLKEFAAPSAVHCLDRQLEINTPIKEAKTVKFIQKPSSSTEDCRFPRRLAACYRIVDNESKKTGNRRRLSRNCLLRQSENDDCFLKPSLLPTTDDLRSSLRTAFCRQAIPFIYPCVDDVENCPVKCAGRVDNLSLFVEVRSFSGTNSIVRQIVDTKDDDVVDKTCAIVAASAVQSKHSQSRWFLPIRKKYAELTYLFDDVEYKVQIEDDVRQIVDDALDFVERQLSVVELTYDPDLTDLNDKTESPSPNKIRLKRPREKNAVIRELKRLINVSVADERSLTDDQITVCSGASCTMGCVCQFIPVKRVKLAHCGRVDCIFGCECSLRFRPRPISLPGELAKNERTWHQTIVRKNNDDVELLSEIERSKREKKPPNRFEIDDVTTVRRCRQKDGDVKVRRKSTTNRKMCQIPKDVDESTYKHLTTKVPFVVLEDVMKTPAAFKLRKNDVNVQVSDFFKNRLSILKEKNALKRFRNCQKCAAKRLSDVLIWCAVHSKYDCLCFNWVLSSRNNNLVGKPSPEYGDRIGVFKALMNTPLNNTEEIGRKVIMFDRTKYSSRTFGSFIDYRRRNDSQLYKQLNRHKLAHKIPSFSNGYFKAKPLATMASEEPISNYPLNGNATSSVGVGTIVKMDNADTTVDIDVCHEAVTLKVEQYHDLTLTSSEDELEASNPSIDPPSELPLNSNVEPLPQPKPKPNKRLKRQPGFSSCHSLLKTNKTVKPRKKPEYKTKSVIDKPDEDSDDDVQIVEVQPPSPIVIDDDDEVEYPAHGIVCMTRPDLGYFPVKSVSPGQVVLESLEDASQVRIFNDAKTACAYIKTFMIDMFNHTFKKLNWSLVTRGILIKFQCSEFDRSVITRIKTEDNVKQIQKLEPSGNVPNDSSSDYELMPKLVPLKRKIVTNSNVTETKNPVLIRLAPVNSNIAQVTASRPTTACPKILPKPNTPTSSGTYIVSSSYRLKKPQTQPSQITMKLPYDRPPLKIKLPPRRADVIIPRSNGYATVISPIQSPPRTGEEVFNGVLVAKNPISLCKAYICNKPNTKPNFQSLLQKR